jgi:hypothetical protein
LKRRIDWDDISKPKPRPVVVEFIKFSDRKMIRTVSERFKGTQFEISPQYPKEFSIGGKK